MATQGANLNGKLIFVSTSNRHSLQAHSICNRILGFNRACVFCCSKTVLRSLFYSSMAREVIFNFLGRAIFCQKTRDAVLLEKYRNHPDCSLLQK